MRAHDDSTGYRQSNRMTAQFVLWTVAWAASLAVARFGPQQFWDPQVNQVASWAAVAVNVLVGLVWIVAFARFLRALDDLQRKIMLDALAVTLGVGWVAGFAYFVADAAGLIAFDLNIAFFPALLGVVYLVAYAIGSIRYR